MFTRNLLCNNLKNQILSSMRLKPVQQQYKTLSLQPQQQQQQYFPLIRRFTTVHTYQHTNRPQLNTMQYRQTPTMVSSLSTRQLSTRTTAATTTTMKKMFKNFTQISNTHHMTPVLLQISTRGFFWRRKPTIQGLVTPKMRRTRRVIRWVAFFMFLLLSAIGGVVWAMQYYCENLDKLMELNISWRGQGDIHYYATEERVHHKYQPLYTGDKVADIKLLQTKLIRDIYRMHLALGPLGKNIPTINRILSEKKVKGLREMAAEDPELAAEITEDVLMEAQYGISLSADILTSMQQHLFQHYIAIAQYQPSHSHSPDDLHENFNRLKKLEEDLSHLVDYTDACLDCLVESTLTQKSYTDYDAISMGLHKPYKRQ